MKVFSVIKADILAMPKGMDEWHHSEGTTQVYLASDVRNLLREIWRSQAPGMPRHIWDLIAIELKDSLARADNG